MALSTYELEKLADEIYKNRIIRGSVHCGICGYNLRTLPHIHTCPECGNQYNARPLKMEGIFVLNDTYFPLGEVVAGLLCALFAAVLIVGGISPVDPGRLTLGVACTGIMIAFVVTSYIRLGRFFKARAIARRIMHEEEDWEEV